MSTLERLTTALATRYRVDRELGAGGMATVYLAHDLRHERDVAIKVLHPDLGAALGADRFLAEIKTLARLQHPHILALIDSGAADGLLYYVMPYVRGETLRGRLQRETQLPIPDAIHIATEVAEALQVAHAAGIVHRDIKPENILLQDGHALVADFGIALAVQQAGGQRMTQTGLSLGTPQYMSPEQAMGERTIDARSDIYALGAMTYEMLTGDAPFTGSSVQAIVARVLTERPSSIRAVRDTVPEHVEAAVLTALAKLPADRFASASDFALALRRPSGVASVSTPSRTPNGSGVRGRVLLVAAVLVALVGGYLGGRRTTVSGATTAGRAILRFPVSVDSPYLNTSLGAAMLVDGSGFAFIGDGPPGHGIYVRRFSDTLYQYLPVADAAVGLYATPDGQSLLVYVFTPNKFSRVMIVPLDGNPARMWTDSLRFGVGVDEKGWLWASHHAIDGLMRVSPDGKTLEQLTRPDTTTGERSHRHVVMLPEGKGALFEIDYADGRPTSIGAYDAAKKRVVTLRKGRPVATIDGQYLVFVSEDNVLSAQRLELRSWSLTGPVVPLSTSATGEIGAFNGTVSTTGDALYFVRLPGEWAIAHSVGDQASVFFKANGKPPRTFRFAPDGKLAALATADGIEFRGRDGSVRRISLGAPVLLSNFLPDGTGALFMRRDSSAQNGKSAHAEVAQLDGASAPTTFDNGPTPLPRVMDARFSAGVVVAARTGAVVVSGSGAAPTEGLLFFPRSGGNLVKLSTLANSPEPSPDGRFVAWVRLASEGSVDQVVMVSALPPAAGAWEIGPGTAPRWSADGKTLFYAEPSRPFDQRAPNVMQVRVDGAAGFRFGASSIAARPPANAQAIWDVNPADGQIYWLTSSARKQMVYVHNFAHLVDSLVTQAGASSK